MNAHVHSIVESLHAYALSLPEAWEDDPWGEVVIKVRKKIFVFLGNDARTADHVSFSVKVPETGVYLLDRDYGEPTGYGLGTSGWVTVNFEPGREPPVTEMCEWIAESYRHVAPKTLVRQFDANPPPRPGPGRRGKTNATRRKR